MTPALLPPDVELILATSASNLRDSANRLEAAIELADPERRAFALQQGLTLLDNARHGVERVQASEWGRQPAVGLGLLR